MFLEVLFCKYYLLTHWVGLSPKHLLKLKPSHGEFTDSIQLFPSVTFFCFEKGFSSFLLMHWNIPSVMSSWFIHWPVGLVSLRVVQFFSKYIGVQLSGTVQLLAALHHFKSSLLSHKGTPLHNSDSSTHVLMSRDSNKTQIWIFSLQFYCHLWSHFSLIMFSLCL